jgi:ubiquitin-protein ligase E3 C
VVEEDVLGRKLEHELIPRGKETPVTNANKLMYVYLCSHWHISRISGSASRAFSRGLSKVVPIQFLRMFTVAEVNEVCLPHSS